MTVPFILRLSAYSYLISSLVIPHQILDITATFLSHLIIPPATDPITHIFKCLILVVSFVVLYTILGVKAIYTQFIQPGTLKPENTIHPSKKVMSAVLDEPSIDSSSVLSLSCAEKTMSEKQKMFNMQSTADTALPTLTKEQDRKKVATIPVGSDSQAPSIVSPTASLTSSNSTDQLIKDLLQVRHSIPSNPVIDPHKVIDQLANGQAHMGLDKGNATTILNEPQAAQLATETLVPRLQLEQITVADHDGASSVQHDHVSDSSNKEETIGKTNNLSTLSDNLQRIFDAPLTPSPDIHNRPAISIQPSKSSSIEQFTPALTPPNPSSATGSTMSRKSSTASHQSFSQFKNRFRRLSGPRQSEKQLEKQPMQVQQQQQIANDSAIDTHSVKKKRFSTILGRKKSVVKVEDPVKIVEEEQQQLPLPPANLKPKKSVSNKLQKGIKKTGKRFSSIFK